MQTVQGQLKEASSKEEAGSSKRFIRYLKSEFLQAILLINLTLVVFFSTPIFTPNSYYLPVDVIQQSDGRLFDLPPYPGNPNVGYIDSLQVFHPQLHYTME